MCCATANNSSKSTKDKESARSIVTAILLFHGGGCQVARAAGLASGPGWVAAEVPEAIVQQLQMWRVEGVRPRQVRHGREHLSRGRGSGGEMAGKAPVNVTGALEPQPGLFLPACAPLKRSRRPSKEAAPGWAHRQSSGPTGSLGSAPHTRHRGRPGHTHSLRWRSPNHSLGKIGRAHV